MSVTVYTPRRHRMRRILALVCEMAQEDVRKSRRIEENRKTDLVDELEEVYEYYDDVVSNASGWEPADARLQEALTVGHFPNYFARVLSRAVYDRYESMMSDWRDYTYQDTLPDYTVAERYQFSEFDRLERRVEKEEAYAGYVYEQTVRQLQVDDYAKQIDFSRRILVNDDLGAFNNIIDKMVDSARRFLDLYVSALYDNATTQAAMLALGVNYWGTGRLTTANLAIAWNAFVQRTDARGNPIVAQPAYLVIPPILQLTADQILQSERIAELATNAVNVLRNRVQVKVDPYITFAGANIPWYLFAAPSAIPAVTVAKMQGQEQDFYVYAKSPDKVPVSGAGALGAADWRAGSFLTGDIELLVETTIGSRIDDLTGLVGVTDVNGLYYSSGTTP